MPCSRQQNHADRRLLQAFHHNGTGTSSSIADTSTSNLALLLAKDTEKSCDYSGTTRTKGVTQSNSTTCSTVSKRHKNTAMNHD